MPLLHPSALFRFTVISAFLKSNIHTVFLSSPQRRVNSSLSASVFSRSIFIFNSNVTPSPAFSSSSSSVTTRLSQNCPPCLKDSISLIGRNCKVESFIKRTSIGILKDPHQPSLYVGPQSFHDGIHSHSLAHPTIILLPSGARNDCGA